MILRQKHIKTEGSLNSLRFTTVIQNKKSNILNPIENTCPPNIVYFSMFYFLYIIQKRLQNKLSPYGKIVKIKYKIYVK